MKSASVIISTGWPFSSVGLFTSCMDASLPRLHSKVLRAAALLPLVFLVPAQAPAAGPMQFLSPQAGWLAGANSLYWTNDAGDNWTDITPLPPGNRPGAPVTFSGIFFRDTSEGWAIVSYLEFPAAPTAFDTGNRVYVVAHTDNSGAAWSFTSLTYPALPEGMEDTFAGPAGIYFVDSLHGWLDIPFAGLSKPGKLLATEDGGNTWNWVNSPSISGPITFSSLQDGWLLSDAGADRLYVTHDGCKNWQEVNLSPPPQVGAAIYPTFQDAPVFQGSQNGHLVVHYSGPPGTPSKLVVYSTSDGGHGWQPVKVLAEAEEGTRSAQFAFAVVDATIIVSTGSSAGNAVNVIAVPLNGGSSDVKASDSWVLALRFGDSANGWAWVAGTGLLTTHDAGSTWKRIGPLHAPSLPTRTAPIQPGRAMKVTNGGSFSASTQTLAPAAATGGSTHITRHLG